MKTITINQTDRHSGTASYHPDVVVSVGDDYVALWLEHGHLHVTSGPMSVAQARAIGESLLQACALVESAQSEVSLEHA